MQNVETKGVNDFIMYQTSMSSSSLTHFFLGFSFSFSHSNEFR